MLELFFIMEREVIMGQGIFGHEIGNPVMFIRKLFPFSGLLGRFGVLIFWKEILPAGFLGALDCAQSLPIKSK